MATTKVERDARVVKHALMFLKDGQTVRSVAKETGFSRSGIWQHLTARLPELDPMLYTKVKEKLTLNKQERAKRGGQAVKEMWANVRNEGR